MLFVNRFKTPTAGGEGPGGCEIERSQGGCGGGGPAASLRGGSSTGRAQGASWTGGGNRPLGMRVVGDEGWEGWVGFWMVGWLGCLFFCEKLKLFHFVVFFLSIK